MFPPISVGFVPLGERDMTRPIQPSAVLDSRQLIKSKGGRGDQGRNITD